MAKFILEIVDRPDHYFYAKVTPPKEKHVIIGSAPASHTYLDACMAYIVIFAEQMKARGVLKATKKNSISLMIADRDGGGVGVLIKPSAQELLAERSRLGEASPQSLLLACDLISVILETSKMVKAQKVITDQDEVNDLAGAINTIKDVMTGH